MSVVFNIGESLSLSLSHSIANPFHVFLKPWIMGSFSQTLWFAKGPPNCTSLKMEIALSHCCAAVSDASKAL